MARTQLLIAATLLMALLQSPAVWAYHTSSSYGSYYTDYVNAITVAGETCFVQPMTFKRSRYDYKMYLQGATDLGDGCTADKVLVSKLYAFGNCIQQRNLEKNGCPSDVTNPVTVSSGSSSDGYRYNTTEAGAECNIVFSSNSANYVPLSQIITGVAFDDGRDICAKSSIGYFYIQNNCPASSQGTTLVIEVETYTGYTSSCSSSSWPQWASITIIALIALMFTGLACAGYNRRRKRMQQPVQVQMATPMYNVPPPAYGPPMGGQPAQNSGSAPYGGSTPYGYPPPPAGYPGGAGGQPVQGYPAPAAGGGALNQGAVWHAGQQPGGYPKV